jgi:hypothetical protein
MFARNSLLAWLVDALLEQLAVLADLLVRGSQFFDHAIEAFAQIFDFVVRAADLDRLEFSLPHRRDALLKQRERAREQTHRDPRDGASRQNRHHAQNHALQQIKLVSADVPQHDHHHHPQQEQADEDRELRG